MLQVGNKVFRGEMGVSRRALRRSIGVPLLLLRGVVRSCSSRIVRDGLRGHCTKPRALSLSRWIRFWRHRWVVTRKALLETGTTKFLSESSRLTITG